MTRDELYHDGRTRLEAAGVPDAAYDARLLLEEVTAISHAALLADPKVPVAAEMAERYRKLIDRRALRIPLQHLLGEAEFMGLTFKVNSDALIPRADTEILVEEALKEYEGRPCGLLLDIGCGSGCIVLSLLHYLKRAGGAWRAVAVDISAKALDLAADNARRLGLDGSVRFIRSDLYAQLGQMRFDLIVSNPPYIPTGEIAFLQAEVRDYDPFIALDGGEDGLDFYRKIIPGAGERLKSEGALFCEIGYDQGESVKEIFGAYGFSGVRVTKDLAGADRLVSGHIS